MSEDRTGVGGKGTTHPFSQWDLRFCLQTRYQAGRKKHLEGGGGSGKDGGDTEQGRYRGAGEQEKGLQAQAGTVFWMVLGGGSVESGNPAGNVVPPLPGWVAWGRRLQFSGLSLHICKKRPHLPSPGWDDARTRENTC